MSSFSRSFSQFFDLVPEEELSEAHEYLRLLTIRWMRAVALLMAGAVMVAWPTDFLLFSDPAYIQFLSVWRMTLGATTLLLSAGLTFVAWFRKHPVTVFNISAVIVMGVSGAAVGHLGGAENPFLFSVYSIPATTVALLTTLPRRIIATLAITVSYLAGFFSTVQLADVPLLLGGPLIFLAASCIGMIFIGHVVYRLVGSNHVRRIRLEQTLAAREQDLAFATRQALTAHEQVRKRVLYDLHDNVGPIITALHLETFAARQSLNRGMNHQTNLGAYLDVVDGHARSLKQTIRSSLKDLDPYGIERGKLTEVLCNSIEELGIKIQHKLVCEVDEAINDLPGDLKQMLFLVVRECANNTLKHAQASQVKVSIQIVDQTLRFRFEDNGRGVSPPGELSGRQGHYGLEGIRLRAMDAGGKANFTSVPGGGFVVAIEVPLTPDVSQATAV